MSNSVWGALERPFDIHKHLASALNDAQYWDDSVSPAQIRTELSSGSPIRSMKWLLASISKGRDVSDFYPDVIKLVGHSDLQVRKLVYTYMNQHCNDAKYQQLSLLSINSLQRGLDDKEPLIRAMAIRAMGSLGLPDVLQIQQLGISKRIIDASPYVRKCAVTAASKLKNIELLDLVVQVLHKDTATMVLGSAIIAFYELTDHAKTEYLELLHPCYRKLCVLLTDMDEYSQVVCLEVLTRYCRNFFREPRCHRHGSAEAIDATRRVVRDATGAIVTIPETTTATTTSDATITPLTPEVVPIRRNQKIIKRRIVKKGFYSDEEDESTEEEVYADTLESVRAPISLREPEVTMSPDPPQQPPDTIDKEEADLDEDHRRLLTAAMPLLKSRNAGVVLAVCALQFYCGVSSVRIRKSMGKALVRIHRDPETQYVVYTSIRRLVRQCPSAFSPFLHDFFVLQMDPPQTRAAKLDILTSLALDPPSIEKVLTELRHYIQWQPQNAKEVEFSCAAISAVGRVAELAKICYTRQSRGSEATKIVLNCLFGLVTVSKVMTDSMIVGESVIVMQRILKLLQPDITPDPRNVRAAATKRILLLLFNTLTKINEFEESENIDDNSDDDDDDDDDDAQVGSHKRWANATAVLPPSASAAAIHWLAEILVSDNCYLENHAIIRIEIARLLAKSFVDLESSEKDQAMFYAFQLLLNTNPPESERRLSERILALGRVDPNTDTRDCARTFSNFIHVSVGLQFDKEALDEPMFQARIDKTASRKSAATVNAYPSYLPFEKEVHYRFGSLSSLMGHKAHASYRPLPDWAAENSPSSIREEPQPAINGSLDTYYRNEDTSSESSELGDDEDSSSSSDYSASDGDESSTGSDDDDYSELGGSDFGSSDNTDASSNAQKVKLSTEGTLLSSFAGNSMQDPVGLLSVGGTIPQSTSGKLISFESPTPPGGLSSDTITNDLRGLVLEQKPTTLEHQDGNKCDFGTWFEVIRPDHSGGLAVRARYVRGETKSKHASSLGLIAGSPTLVVMQFQFENVQGTTPFRHIRIVQRSSSSTSSVIIPSRVLVPEEIPILNVGAEARVVVCINFNDSSDRDGASLAKLEAKSGSGGMPFEIRPRILDLLLPCSRSIDEFDAAVGRMHGFNRLETKVAASASMKGVTQQLLNHSSLTLISPRDGEADKKARLVGSLPSSSDPIFVQVDSLRNETILVVCCEHALVLSPVMNQLKKALKEMTSE